MVDPSAYHPYQQPAMLVFTEDWPTDTLKDPSFHMGVRTSSSTGTRIALPEVVGYLPLTEGVPDSSSEDGSQPSISENGSSR